MIPKLTVREKETKERFAKYQEISIILSSFYAKGFKSYAALKAIMLMYYPGIDLDKLKSIWNFKVVDAEVKKQMEIVFEKLKSE